jgi:hypothetical protein
MSMPHTYRAVLRGDRIEWIDKPPDDACGRPVHVTVLDQHLERSPQERGRAMAGMLEELSRGGAFASIPDPETWQGEVRRDHTLIDWAP